MKQQSVIVRPSSKNELSVIKAFFEALKIKFEVTDKSPYDAAFVSKIQRSRKQAASGRTVKVDLDEIWK